MLKLNFIGGEEIARAVAHLSEKLGFEISEDGVKVEVLKCDSGLMVQGLNGTYIISYGVIPDFCRGLCILIDKIKKESCEDFLIKQERKISKCGIMADVSRNAVLRVDTAKDIISRIARMGMNTFMLYMEDVYKMEEYPYFGYMRGAYTEDELKEIDNFALDLGVEVVPCIQTLAHLASTIRWSYMHEMCDTSDVLLVGCEKTYEFIDNMISTVSRCFSSRRIHIGMDEAWGLGTGVYKKLNGEVDKFEIMSFHLKKVVEILHKYDKEPVMWSDMLFRIASKNGNYYDAEAGMPDNILEIVPKDVTLAFWDYYNEKTQKYRDMLRIHEGMQRKIAFFGGIWTWNGVCINYDKTFRTTKPAMEACYESGIDEICATLWRDDGGETAIYTALLGMQLYSEYAYSEDVTKEQLENMFYICTGYRADDFLLFDFDNLPEGDEFKAKLSDTPADIGNIITASKHILYQDVLQGLFDKQYEDVDLKGHYGKIYDKFRRTDFPQDLKELFEYYEQLAKVLHLKADIGLRVTASYKNKNRQALEENVEEIRVLYSEICVLHEKLSRLWMKENKAFGLDRLDLRIGGLKERILRTESRLKMYLEGEIESIEELEEEKLTFSPKKKFPASRLYNSFISASIG